MASRSRGAVRKAERWVPPAYLLAAILVAVLVLPSVLRITPPAQSQSAELSPDAPPDRNQQTFISAFSRGVSGTAGDAVGEGTGEPGPAGGVAGAASGPGGPGPAIAAPRA